MTSSTQHPHTVIHPRFTGLPGVVHGGYLSGLMADALGADSAEVKLRRPVPPGKELELRRIADHLELVADDTVLAKATPTDLATDVPAAVSIEDALAASTGYLGFERNPIPYCFVCGPYRHHHDGLHIFPGAVPGRDLVAAPWVPPGDHGAIVPAELVWASLDCPQLWALIMHAPADSPDSVVTAALSGRIHAPVVAGEQHVVIAWPIGREGRTWRAGAAVFGPDGELRAAGVQTAAITDWGVPLGRAHWGAQVAAA